MNQLFSKALCGVSLVALSACATTEGSQTDWSQSKAILGAALGAGIGALAGLAKGDAGSKERENALIGAGLGALAGAGIGRYMDTQEAELRQSLANSPVEVVREDAQTIKLVMENSITFGYDSSDVMPSSYPVLNDVARVMTNYPQTLVDVIGHTDSVGSTEYNMTLSQRRAAAVAIHLVNRGVMNQRVVVYGMGEAQPVASNETDFGRAQNRRVEIKIRPFTQ